MVMTSWPRVNEDTTDAQYAELFNSIIGTGLRDTSSLVVSADSSGLNVKVSAGFAVVAGTAFLSTAVETLTIAGNTGTTNRIDSVILRRSFSATAGSTVALVVKQGTTSAPALTKSATGTFEFLLANVTVAAGAATITSANVTTSRDYLATNVGVWSTSNRPAARPGLFGFNTSTGAFEGHNGSAWGPLVTWATLSGKPTVLPLAEGGTGATSAAAARTSIGAAASSHTHPWGQITGTPSTFPPATHGHSLNDGTIVGTLSLNQGGTGATTATAARTALGAAASSHTHPWSQITGKPSTFSPSDHTHPWSEVTGKPVAYTPAPHGHSLADPNITGTLPVNQGGTGATNAAAALQALGIYVQASAPSHSNGRVWIKRP